MATNPDDPGRIDITLGLLGEGSDQLLANFTQQLEEVNKSFRAVMTEFSAMQAKYIKDLADTFKQGASGGGVGGASSSSSVDAGRKEEKSEPSVGASDQAQPSPTEAPTQQVEEQSRQSLFDRTKSKLTGLVTKTGSDGASIGGDNSGNSGGGDSSGGGTGQTGPGSQSGKNSQDADLSKGLHFGNYTLPEMLMWLGRQQETGLGQGFGLDKGNFGPNNSSMGDVIGGLGTAVGTGRAYGSLLGLYTEGGRQFTGQLAGFDVGPNKVQEVGAQMGNTGMGPGGTIPGTDLGYGFPVGGAYKTGLGHSLQTADLTGELARRFGARVGRQKADEIQNAGDEMGWISGGPGQEAGGQQDAIKQMVSQNTVNNPAYDPAVLMQVADRTVGRLGTSSLAQLTDLLQNQLPAAAIRSHTELNTFVEQMSQVGSSFESMGAANPVTAMKTATTLSQGTGLNGPLLQPMIDNPMTQMFNLASTGVMPWAQGNLPASTWGDSMTSAMNMYMGAMGGGKAFGNTTTTDSIGVKHTITGEQQAIDFSAQQMGVQPALAQYWWKNRTKIHAALGANQGWQDYSDAYDHNKNNPQGLKALLNSNSRDPNQNPLGYTAASLQASGASRKDIQKFVADAKTNRSKASQDLQKMVNKVLPENNQGGAGPNAVTIELGTQAQKHFHLNSKGAQLARQAAAGNGGPSSVYQFANNATIPPDYMTGGNWTPFGNPAMSGQYTGSLSG